MSDTSQPASNHSTPTPGAGTRDPEYESTSSASSHKGEDQTLQTSQHGARPQQGLGTSPTQLPHPGHTSTPNQSLGSAVGKDRAASKQVKPPSAQRQLEYSSFVEDAVWTSSNNSRNLSNHPANFSAREWQEFSDHLEAIDMASQEWTRSRSGISTPANSTLLLAPVHCLSLPTMGQHLANTPLWSLEMIRGYYLAISLVLEGLFVRVLLPLVHLQPAPLGHQLPLPLVLLLHRSSILLKGLRHLAMLDQENNGVSDYFLTWVCKRQRHFAMH